MMLIREQSMYLMILIRHLFREIVWKDLMSIFFRHSKFNVICKDKTKQKIL